MKKLALLLTLAALPFTARAASTINATNAYAWGANIGWTNWLPSPADGVVIGEFICSGYIYGANVGWINVGNGNPVNHIQYQNNSATDYGLNYGVDPTQPGFAILRGYAYSANCGWINLNDALGKVQTNSVAMGVDSDGNGIADAWEYLYFGGLLGAAGANADPDHDGLTNLQEYLDGTSPIISTDRLRITAFATNSAGTSSPITWTSTTARLYVIETKPDLLQVTWDLDPTFGTPFAPDAGTLTMRNPTAATATKRFYRVRSIRPLP